MNLALQRTHCSQIMFLAEEFALAKGAADVEHTNGQVSRFVHHEAQEKAAREALLRYVAAVLAAVMPSAKASETPDGAEGGKQDEKK